MSREIPTDSEALQAFADLVTALDFKETRHILGAGLPLASYYGYHRGEGYSPQESFTFALKKYAGVLEDMGKRDDPSQYRRLEKDEVILPTDECYDDDKKAWLPPTYSIGGLAPDPNYTAHRQFRRKIGDDSPLVGNWSPNDVAIFAGQCIGLKEENVERLLNREKINWRIRRRDGQVVIRRKVSDIPIPNRVNLTISNGIVTRVEMF